MDKRRLIILAATAPILLALAILIFCASTGDWVLAAIVLAALIAIAVSLIAALENL